MRAVIGPLYEQAFGEIPQAEFQLRFRHLQHLLQVGKRNSRLGRMQTPLLLQGGNDGLALLARLAHDLRGSLLRLLHTSLSAVDPFCGETGAMKAYNSETPN